MEVQCVQKCVYMLTSQTSGLHWFHKLLSLSSNSILRAVSWSWAAILLPKVQGCQLAPSKRGQKEIKGRQRRDSEPCPFLTRLLFLSGTLCNGPSSWLWHWLQFPASFFPFLKHVVQGDMFQESPVDA